MSWDTYNKGKRPETDRDMAEREWEAILYTKSEDNHGHSEEYRVKLPKHQGRLLAKMRDDIAPGASIKDMIRAGVQHLPIAVDRLSENISPETQAQMDAAIEWQEAQSRKERENWYVSLTNSVGEDLASARDYPNKNYFWDMVYHYKRLAQSLPEPYKSQVYSTIEKYS